MPRTWERAIELGIRDFFADLAHELRAEIRRARAEPEPPKKKASPPRTDQYKEAAEAKRELERAWKVLERFGDPHIRGGHGSRPPSTAELKSAFRVARHATHPDRKPGKSSRDFLRVQHAADVLGKHYNTTL